MTLDHGLVLLVGFLAMLLIGAILWGLLREHQFSQVQRMAYSSDVEVVSAIKDVHAALVKVCDRLEARATSAKEHQEELRRLIQEGRQLTLDVERRLEQSIHSNRDFCRQSGGAPNIFNSVSDGGQTNQGQNVKGNQK